MAQHEHLDPSSFVLPGGRVGVLMVHGFSGSPTELRGIGDALHSDGHTVHGVLVAGHGKTFEEFESVGWKQWVQSVRQAFVSLEKDVDEIYLVGQSTGAVLAQHLIDEDKVKGVIAVAPAFWVRTRLLPHSSWWKYVQRRVRKGIEDILDQDGLKRVWSYDELPTKALHELYLLQMQTRPLLRDTRQPLLIFQGRHDKTVHRASAQRMLDMATTNDKKLVYLDDSAHLVSVDRDHRRVTDHVREWIRARSALEAGNAPLRGDQTGA